MSEENKTAASPPKSRREDRRWLIKLIAGPALFLAAGALLIIGLGLAQRLGWITAGGRGSGGEQHASTATEQVRYICPMMCTPPQSEPGRCPVCAMELVPAASGGSDEASQSIEVDPVARRVANIRTAKVMAVPFVRNIRAVGKLSYDEGRLKTIAAYVDGRIERLYADYTGVVVEKGDRLALVYSPQLYSGQVELLVAKRAQQRRPSTSANDAYGGRDLYGSARERLIEFGMTESQIDELERKNEADSRMHLSAPISGTVVEKLAVEGEYVKTGQPIYRLADLSTVWLMLELFPEDAAAVRYGQKVDAEVQSLPGRKFSGRVAFINPTVEPGTRTIGVRVVIPNPQGLLRVGDYAKATIAVEVDGAGGPLERVYDPELAGKWISPRHPHVVESQPGACRECGVELMPAARFGFASQPIDGRRALVVPRSAVLIVGETSVVYVETEPGRFETRRVVLGPSTGDRIAILKGLEEGERVATSGNFLIDSQMQLVGNPSLIDPAKAKDRAGDAEDDVPRMELPPIGGLEIVDSESPAPPIAAPQIVKDEDDDIAQALVELPPSDRALVETQQICPVTEMPLGSMGTPIKVDVDGRPVFICCEGCRESLLAEPAKYLARLPKEAAQ